ncbi:MAG: hypothetical protein AMXMBFR46_13680 [Acidimicrobiia bacterium]
MPQIGPLEIAVVLLIALLVFGPNRLPEMARQVGGALRELRRFQHNIRQDLHELMADERDGAAPAPTLPPKEPFAPGPEPTAGLPPTDRPPSDPTEPAPPPDQT